MRAASEGQRCLIPWGELIENLFYIYALVGSGKMLNRGSSTLDLSNGNRLLDVLTRRKPPAEGIKDFKSKSVDFFPPELWPVYTVNVQNEKNYINVGKHYHNCFWHRNIFS